MREMTPIEALNEAYALVEREAPKLGPTGSWMLARAALQSLKPETAARLFDELFPQTPEARA
jgi:hypothetical protein